MRSEPMIAEASTAEDLDAVRALFREYVAGLGVDLSFQDFAGELAALPGRYAAPAGAILLARDAAGDALGCVALRPLPAAGDCEMKRLYVREAARGRDLGLRLAEAVIARARAAGHRRMLLDTLASMIPALALYARLGFRPVAAYYDNPLPDVVYLALDL